MRWAIWLPSPRSFALVADGSPWLMTQPQAEEGAAYMRRTKILFLSGVRSFAGAKAVPWDDQARRIHEGGA